MVVIHAQAPFFELRFEYVVYITAGLPLGSLISCVLLSMVLHFDQVTKTHCNVPNYVPSISAATGDFSPEKYIWRIGIAYHSVLRILMACIYYQFYKNKANSQNKWFKWLNRLNSSLHIMENTALVVLTYVSSTDNFAVHEASFIMFMVTSMIYMMLTCCLFQWTARNPITYEECVSLRWKVLLLLINYSSFAAAVYFFFRHNWYCEPGVLPVYSLFGLCEYGTVISNIAFHSTLYLDVKGTALSVGYGMNTMTKKQ